jgi:hypothetical protein
VNEYSIVSTQRAYVRECKLVVMSKLVSTICIILVPNNLNRVLTEILSTIYMVECGLCNFINDLDVTRKGTRNDSS